LSSHPFFLAVSVDALERTSMARKTRKTRRVQDPDDVDPQHYLDEVGKDMEVARLQTPKLLESLSGRRIFFYPACGFDWNPLHRFTHFCDASVYCDYRMTVDDFNNWKESILKGVVPGIGLEVGAISNLDTQTVMDLATPDAEQAHDFPNVGGAWGKVIDLTRHIGNLKRKIRLLYFRAEGVTLYRNLFNKQSIAPRMVCLKQCQDGFGGQNWTTFLRWDGPLGRAVWENRGRPEFVVSAYDYDPNAKLPPPDPQGHRYDWPWSRVWQQHQHQNWQSGGHGKAAQLTSYVLPNALPASAGTPTRLAGGEFRRPLNKRTIIRLKRPQDAPANIAAGATQIPLRRDNARTLEMALRKLRETCVREGITDVYSIGCHFEDEAPALYAWKWSGKQPKTLTIHCESEGDLACYGPAADEVLD
jgi:hypothetical protein